MPSKDLLSLVEMLINIYRQEAQSAADEYGSETVMPKPSETICVSYENEIYYRGQTDAFAVVLNVIREVRRDAAKASAGTKSKSIPIK